MELINSFPANIIISSVSAHALTLPELPDGQTTGSALVATFSEGQTFVASGWVNGEDLNAGTSNPSNTMWWKGGGFYVWSGSTQQQPDPASTPLTAPPSDIARLTNLMNAETAASANPITVVANGVSGIWNSVTGGISKTFTSAMGGDITDIIILVVVVFVIYTILSTGTLNLVHFKKKAE